MLDFAEKDGISISVGRYAGKGGSFSNKVNLRGESLHVILNTWGNEAGFTRSLHGQYAVPLRQVLRKVTAVLYMLAHEDTRPGFWAWLSLDCLWCGQALVSVLGPDIITPTMHECFHHGPQKLLQVAEVEAYLGLEGKLSLRIFGEWGAESVHRLRALEFQKTSKGGSVRHRKKARREDGGGQGPPVVAEQAGESSSGGMSVQEGEGVKYDGRGRDVLVSQVAIAELVNKQFVEYGVREIFPRTSTEGQVARRQMRKKKDMVKRTRALSGDVVETEEVSASDHRQSTRRGYADASVSHGVCLEWMQQTNVPPSLIPPTSSFAPPLLGNSPASSTHEALLSERTADATSLSEMISDDSDSEILDTGLTEEDGRDEIFRGEGHDEESRDPESEELGQEASVGSTTLEPTHAVISSENIAARLDSMWVPNQEKVKAESVLVGSTNSGLESVGLYVTINYKEKTVRVMGCTVVEKVKTRRKIILRGISHLCLPGDTNFAGHASFAVRAFKDTVSFSTLQDAPDTVNANSSVKKKGGAGVWVATLDSLDVREASQTQSWWRFWITPARFQKLQSLLLLRVPHGIHSVDEAPEAETRGTGSSRRAWNFGIQRRVEPVVSHPECVPIFLDALETLRASMSVALRNCYETCSPHLPTTEALEKVVSDFRSKSLLLFKVFERECDKSEAKVHSRGVEHLNVGESDDDADQVGTEGSTEDTADV